MSRKKSVIFDLEGTLYTKQGLLTEASETIRSIRGKGLEVRFMTNSDSLSQRSVFDHMKSLGLQVFEEEVYTPSRMIKEYYSPSIKSAYLLTSKEIKNELSDIADDDGGDGAPSHVIIGDTREVFSYDAFNQAFRFLDKGAKLLIMQGGKYFLSGNEKNIDTGAVVSIFSDIAREKILVGKPSQQYLQYVIGGLSSSCTDDTLLAGDDIFSDIKMGADNNVDTVLVKSGKYSFQKDLNADIVPKYTVGSISEILGLL